MGNNKPKIIDLYSGVGGLSLGAVKSGFELVAAVEKEKRILDSHAVNFPHSKHINEDVSKITGKTLIELAGLRDSEVAGLIGGPPCQGFSTIGKRKPDDDRNKLFNDFFRLANEVRPAFFMAENVPGILNSQYNDIREKAFSLVEKHYDLVQPIKINASEYGAATTRTRVFFIGVRKDISGASAVTDAILKKRKTNSVFVKDALFGLPVEVSLNWNDYLSSWQKVSKENLNDYIIELNGFVEHLGDEKSINRYINKSEVSGFFATIHSKNVEERYARLVPGQRDEISKSIKLKQEGLCPTLRAGTDSTKGSYQAVRPIHPTEARVITPREAARLQGFPDWFQFHETRWHSFRQIGNSVCPVAAEKVLGAIKSSLNI